MAGSYGKMLHVDLTKGEVSDYNVPEEYSRLYLGGKALAARLLFDFIPEGADPLSESNSVIITTGPLVGHNVMGSGRYLVMTKSPLSKFIAEAYGGGYFPYALKGTGYDGVILTGKSPKPVLLEMVDGNVELVDASEYWGKGVFFTHDSLIEKYGKKARTMLIGPAGENLVRFAAIINDKDRAAARGGVGAVLGSKLFKGIVAKGSQKAELKDPAEFKNINKVYRDGLVNGVKMKERFGVLGTSGGIPSLHKMSILPTKNFKYGKFEDHDKISGQFMEESGLLVGRETCSACLTYCKRVIEGEYGGEKLIPNGSSLEYETLAGFGSMLLNNEIKAIGLANQLCNDLGIDTISAGGSLAFTMEATERGLGEKLGVKIQWGDRDKIIEALHKIAKREDYGDVIAEGVMRMAEKIGGQEFAMHAKGLEIAYHEPRGKKGLGLSYAVSSRGGSHMEGFHDTIVMREGANPALGAEKAYSRFDIEGKAPLVAKFEDVRSFTNSLVICSFDVVATGSKQNIDYLLELTNAATGYDLSFEDMLEVGARSTNLMRLFAIREGLSKSDDDLPYRFKHESIHYGDDGDQSITEEELEKMLSEYYIARGWDGNGRPTDETIQRLKINL